MDNNLKTGFFHLKVNGKVISAKGNFKYNMGAPKHEALLGSDGSVVQIKQVAQVPFIEGEIYDRFDQDLSTILQLNGGTATLELSNNKVIILRDCYYAGSGDVGTDEGNITFRLEAFSAEEMKR